MVIFQRGGPTCANDCPKLKQRLRHTGESRVRHARENRGCVIELTVVQQGQVGSNDKRKKKEGSMPRVRQCHAPGECRRRGGPSRLRQQTDVKGSFVSGRWSVAASPAFRARPQVGGGVEGFDGRLNARQKTTCIRGDNGVMPSSLGGEKTTYCNDATANPVAHRLAQTLRFN